MSLIHRDNKVSIGFSLFAVVIFKSKFLIRSNNRYGFGQCAIPINTISDRSSAASHVKGWEPREYWSQDQWASHYLIRN